MKTVGLVLLVGVLLVAAKPGAAHPHNYVGVVDGVLVCNAGGRGYDVGGLCFAPGHLTPDSVVTIHDEVSPHVSGSVCQDWDGDEVCDTFNSTPFCDSFSVAPLGPGLAFIVLFDGPVFGNPILSLCGDLSSAVAGHADHT